MDFLENIVTQKRLEVARRKLFIQSTRLVSQLDVFPTRDFCTALSGGGRIIAEVKRKSPRVCEFRADLAVPQFVRTYELNGASAISIVTDVPNFGTSLADARIIRENTAIPLLIKDFIIDPYQVYEARAFGADAILLIARILPPTTLASLLYLTHTLGMEALVEVHTEPDIRKATDAGARAIGINNRDLGSLEVTLDVTRRLIGSVPKDTLVVSESGIRNRREIEELMTLGVDAFLIGSVLLGASDPGDLLRNLVGHRSIDGSPSGSHSQPT